MSGAGLISTTPDFYRFKSKLANRGKLDRVRLLKKDTITTMAARVLTGFLFTISFDDGRAFYGMAYGLGMGAMVSGVRRFGWPGGSGTSAWVYPRQSVVTKSLLQ